jgi:hypothetical protein
MCDQRAGPGTVKCIAAVATFRVQGPPGAAEALDTLNDAVIQHRRLPPSRRLVQQAPPDLQ